MERARPARPLIDEYELLTRIFVSGRVCATVHAILGTREAVNYRRHPHVGHRRMSNEVWYRACVSNILYEAEEEAAA